MALAHDVLVRISTGELTRVGLAAALNRSAKAITAITQKLRDKGLIEITAPGRYDVTDKGWELLKAGDAIPSKARVPCKKSGGVSERVWWVLRARRKVTVNDLVATIDTTTTTTANLVYRYLYALRGAGIVSVSHPGANGQRSYRLVRDLGRAAPVWRRRANEIYDPNAEAVYPISAQGPENDEEAGGDC